MEFQKTLKRAFFSIVNISGNLFCKVFFIDFVSEIYLDLNAKKKYILKGERSWQKIFSPIHKSHWCFPLWASLQCGRPGLDPWGGKIPWRRAWQPTPVFLPGESPGKRNLVGYSPWGHKESDTTEQLSTFSSLSLQILFFLHPSSLYAYSNIF